MAYRRTPKKPMGEINVVPYIDVMLVLLVIFMITAPLLTQGVKVELPQAEAETVPPSQIDPLVVTVDAQGTLHLAVGSAPAVVLDAESLSLRVAATLRMKPKTPVYVRGDRNVAYGNVVTVMAMLQKAGVPGVGLLTEPPEGQ